MNPVTLSSIASLCLAKADSATSPLVQLAWVAMARSIVVQEHRMKSGGTIGAMAEAAKFYAMYQMGEQRTKRDRHAPVN